MLKKPDSTPEAPRKALPPAFPLSHEFIFKTRKDGNPAQYGSIPGIDPFTGYGQNQPRHR
jgi:hypothetical protein